MTSLPIAPPTARAGTALKTAAPPPGAAGGDFAALLTSTSARTAPAEGPKTRQQDAPRRDAAAPRKDDAPKADRSDDAQAAPAAPSKDDNKAPVADASTQQQPGADQTPAPQPPATPPAPPADPAAAAAAQAAAQAALAQQQPAVPAAPAPGAPGQPATSEDGVPSDPKALLQAADAQAPGDPDATAAATDGTQGKLQIPAELLNAKGDGKAGDHGKGAKDGQAKHELPPAPTLPPTADAAATPAPSATPSTAQTLQAAAPDTTAAQAPAPVAQGQPAATPQTLVPTAAGAGMGGAALTRGSVVQAAERVQELVRIATTRGGNARATLQLKPEALGQVDVHLRTTREGLVATIAAHDQAGLDALQQAGGDLRRMLADRGVELRSLDLQLGAGAEGFSNQGDARQASSGRSGGGASYDLDGDEDVTAEDLTISTTPLTATSALVDVTA
jgi:flagellar hook-length control protein FliK